jgi:hypothetical protein
MNVQRQARQYALILVFCACGGWMRQAAWASRRNVGGEREPRRGAPESRRLVASDCASPVYPETRTSRFRRHVCADPRPRRNSPAAPQLHASVSQSGTLSQASVVGILLLETDTSTNVSARLHRRRHRSQLASYALHLESAFVSAWNNDCAWRSRRHLSLRSLGCTQRSTQQRRSLQARRRGRTLRHRR